MRPGADAGNAPYRIRLLSAFNAARRESPEARASPVTVGGVRVLWQSPKMRGRQ